MPMNSIKELLEASHGHIHPIHRLVVVEGLPAGKATTFIQHENSASEHKPLRATTVLVYPFRVEQ